MNWTRAVAERLGLLEQLDRRDSVLSRRHLLLGGAALSTLLASRAKAVPSPTGLRLLVNRLTMGYTESERLLAESLGYYGYLEYHLDYQAIDDSALNQRMALYDFLNASMYNLLSIPISSYIVNQLVEATFVRAVYSKRQLYERMVEFWTDHFNIDIKKGLCNWLKPVDERDVIRPHALGRFPDMLRASALSATMQIYLDNWKNTGASPNENYAREIMELHTMGASGGYTQQDVHEVARCFTGWGVNQSADLHLQWTFEYHPADHDDGPKTVLGQSIPAGGGMSDGFAVIDILAAHPSTAAFVSKKLCRRFWGYDPPQSLVNSVAATYLATGGDIKEMLRALFSNVDPAVVPAKYKRPFHLFVSAMRATGADFSGVPYALDSEFRQHLRLAGHEPYHWGPPNGYPDKLEHWAGLVLPRWNFGLALMNGQIDGEPGTAAGASVNLDAFLAGASTVDAVVDRIDAALFGGTMAPSDRTQVRDFLLPDPPPPDRIRVAVGLALASPGFQWY